MVEFIIGKEVVEGFFDKSLLSFFQAQIQQSLGEIACEKHGKSPTIKIDGFDEDTNMLDFNITGCCDDFEKKVAEVLSEIF